MAVTRRPTYADQTVTETQSVTFNRDPDDIFPVFVAGEARQAGTIWAVDANVGRYGDPFRFTFRKPDQQGSVVSMGISPMSAIAPSGAVAIGASHIELPISGPLNVRVVRARGPVIEFDLNGDGRTDVSLYERVDPERPRTDTGARTRRGGGRSRSPPSTPTARSTTSAATRSTTGCSSTRSRSDATSPRSRPPRRSRGWSSRRRSRTSTPTRPASCSV